MTDGTVEMIIPFSVLLQCTSGEKSFTVIGGMAF